MNQEVEYTNEFGDRRAGLSDDELDNITAVVELLMEHGPRLRLPYSSGVSGSRHSQMRELPVQSPSRPLRVFYAFDPRRSAILLIGGDKTGNARFYKQYVPVADRLYDVYLEELRQEGLIR